MDATLTTAEIAALDALDALDGLLKERQDCIMEGRPKRAIAARIRWAKAEFRRTAALAGVTVTP
jgi:hypothetical protein